MIVLNAVGDAEEGDDYSVDEGVCAIRWSSSFCYVDDDHLAHAAAAAHAGAAAGAAGAADHADFSDHSMKALVVPLSSDQHYLLYVLWPSTLQPY